jgi:transposase
LSDLFGLTAVPATLARLIGRTADRLQPFVKAVRDRLSGPQVEVVHLDETGLRVQGKTQWLHVICSPLLSHFRVSPRRGDLLTGVSGLVVHDHWAPYFKMEGVEHALCNAHHLRELQALIEIEKEGWASAMKRECLIFCV